jgi:hypothetical protein
VNAKRRITVTRRARRHEDRGGDPLDGLVNLFDLGIVLSVGFLLAALSSLNLDELLTSRSKAIQRADQVVVKPGERARPLTQSEGRVVGRGREVGKVYRLADGRLVYVEQASGAAPASTPAPGSTQTPGSTPAPASTPTSTP